MLPLSHSLLPVHPDKLNIIFCHENVQYVIVINAFSMTQLMGNYVACQFWPVYHYVY